MLTTITANQIQGRAIGALFFTCFGGLWFLLALAASGQLNASSASALAVGTGLLALVCILLRRKGGHFRREEEDPAVQRAFGRVNAIQWIAIFVVAFVFGRLHWDAYTPSAVTAIVGLHMFPLARLFRYPLHYLNGAVLVAWALASIFVAPVAELQSTTAAGTGSLLWISAVITLAVTFGKAGGARSS